MTATPRQSPHTADRRRAHLPTPRYTDETIRLVVREWAAANRGICFAGEDVRRADPALARALDALLEEYRQR
jgi:hypothetical protein